MARIRTIKPAAFDSDTLSAVSILARWTFAGLWTYCDDEGRGRHDVRLIKAALFPLDDKTTLQHVSQALQELTAGDNPSVCLYEVDGKALLHVPQWKEHQRISHPTPSKLSPCSRHSPELSGEAPESIVKPPEPLRPEGKGREEGKEGKRATTRTPSPTPDTWTGPTDKHAAQAKELDLDLKFETDKFLDSWRARGVKYKDPDAAFRNWLRQSAKWGGSSYSPNTAPAPVARHVPLEVPAHIDPDDGPAYAAWLRAEAK